MNVLTIVIIIAIIVAIGVGGYVIYTQFIAPKTSGMNIPSGIVGPSSGGCRCGGMFPGIL